MEPLEEHLPEEDSLEEFERGLFEIQKVNPAVLQDLGQKMNKRLGVNVIQSAQLRETSDFIFDLESALITIDTTQRKTYTVPFLEKDDRYSTFNLVVVTDSLDNLLDQYILQYGFDSLQYSTFLASGDFLESGVEIKRFSFSSFFNDSNPLSLERCQGISDENGDPVVCDQVTIDSGSSTTGGGGSSGGGTAWITPGGGGGGSGVTCSWIVYIIPCNCHPHHTTQACGCPDGKPRIAMQITCKSPHMRNSYASQGQMTCMDCDISDFGSPAFTPTKISTAINRDLGGNLSDFHLWYLSENPAFAIDFRSALLADATVDVDAALFTLAAEMNGVLDGAFTPEFALAVDELVEADLSNPATLHFFYTYFSAKAALLKLENPQKYLKNPNGSSGDPNNIYSARLYMDVFSEAAHWTLDILGFIPVLGEPADVLSAGIYILEGDGVNATISLASTIPLYGIIASGSRMGWKVVGSASGLESKKILKWVVDPEGFITFGYRSDLAKNFPSMNTATHQAHHIIPWEKPIQRHPVVQKAADRGFHLNEALNGIPVIKSRNQPNHSLYNNRIEEKLNDIKRRFPENQWESELVKLVNRAKSAIQNNPNKHLNEISF